MQQSPNVKVEPLVVYAAKTALLTTTASDTIL